MVDAGRIVVTGKVSWFDYTVAAIDRPLANGDWVPVSDTAYRPALQLSYGFDIRSWFEPKR